jgi:hypothetical protein
MKMKFQSPKSMNEDEVSKSNLDPSSTSMNESQSPNSMNESQSSTSMNEDEVSKSNFNQSPTSMQVQLEFNFKVQFEKTFNFEQVNQTRKLSCEADES